jgi:MYXO-CTERM domain-containing protein
MAEQTSALPDATRNKPAPDVTRTDLSPEAIEAEIALTRAHLASTINELTVRAQPREIIRRQKESAKAKFVRATHTPEGGLRVERVAAISSAGAAVLVVLALLHRRRRRG